MLDYCPISVTISRYKTQVLENSNQYPVHLRTKFRHANKYNTDAMKAIRGRTDVALRFQNVPHPGEEI